MPTPEDYELCERENTNLRRHLLWAAARLSPESIRELRDRIEKPIADGGVVENMAEDEREEELRRNRAIERLCDHIAKGMESEDRVQGGLWWAQLDELANQLRGFLRPGPLPLTLHEIRNATSRERPANCRNRLRDEGKAYPRSGCDHCRTGGMTGCPYERAR